MYFGYYQTIIDYNDYWWRTLNSINILKILIYLTFRFNEFMFYINKYINDVVSW